MASSTACRLLIDPPAGGPWNMAVDEVLLDWAARSGGLAWRFYRWSRPTLSLGYFQRYADRAEHTASAGCPAVRRLTGGGAILHDVELTYSASVPAAHPLAVRRDGLFGAVHGSLVEVLRQYGLAATLCTPAAVSSNGPEPFLCFQRRAPGDVLVGEVKVAGSAQRRRRGAILQHGSILLRRSPFAPELPGLEDLAAIPISPEELADRWLVRLPEALGCTWHRQPLVADEQRRAADLAQTRYGSAAWTEARVR